MAISDFLINTDSPLDKVVYMATGSFSVASGDSSEINVPHGLSFRPLTIGTWSNEPSFSISYEQGTSGFSSLGVPQLTIQSTPTNLRFIPLNSTGSTITYYWRVFGFMPSDVNEIANFTASTADNYTINSELNYSKLWQSGVLSWSSGTQTIQHNFGYKPQIDIWFEQELNADYLTRWFQGLDNSYTGFDRILVTDTEVVFNFGSTSGVPGRKFYFRIYSDTGVPS